MANSADPDQLASSDGFFRSQLIWIYTVCKDRTYPGSAGQGLSIQNDIGLDSSFESLLKVIKFLVFLCNFIKFWIKISISISNTF